MGNFAAKVELSAISQLPERGRALCRGYIESITIAPANRAPEFSAVVTDVDKYAPRQSINLARGDRIAQMVIQRVEYARFVPVAELPDSVRVAGGFGSTGGFTTTPTQD